MGMTCEGVLFWGFPVDPNYAEEHDDPEEDFMASRGMKYEDFPDTPEYLKKKKEFIGKLNVAAGIVWGCCREPSIYVYIESSRKVAEWGEMVPVDSLEVGEAWEKNLKEFCDGAGIPWETPRWFVTSYYG